MRGFGSLLNSEARSKFARELLMWSDIYIPNEIKSDCAFYNGFRDTVEVYDDDDNVDDGRIEIGQQNHNNHIESRENDSGTNTNPNALIKTANVKVYLEILRYLLKSDDRTNFLLYGPAGCGKT